MPNGYGLAMNNFFKDFKIHFSTLREKDSLSVDHVDDSYLQGDDCENCLSNDLNTIQSSWIDNPPIQIQIYTNTMHHLLRIYFKLCRNDNYSNSGEKRKNSKSLPRCFQRICNYVRVISDNRTAVSYVNNKEGNKSEICNQTVKEL